MDIFHPVTEIVRSFRNILGSVSTFAPENFQFKPLDVPNISTPIGSTRFILKTVQLFLLITLLVGMSVGVYSATTL